MILIGEDDPISRRLLEANLKKWGHEVVTASDGTEAWEKCRSERTPELAILDWMMPGMDGVQVCRRIREELQDCHIYLILLTARDQRSDIVEGLSSGADDYVVKPFDAAELRARVQVGLRIVELQRTLANRVTELQRALDQVRRLEGLLPICSYCKKIRRDGNYWDQVEHYFAEHSGTKFSHSVCPDCYQKEVVPQLEALKSLGDGASQRNIL